MIQGADKTTRFIGGVLMMMGGLYLFLQSVHVNFGMNMPLYYVGRTPITSGYIFIPFMLGIAMVFYNSKGSFGWLLTLGSLAVLVLGIITRTQLSLQHMNAFQLLMILVLMVGGLGMWLSSMRDNK
jgi:uncharacterized protein